PRPNETRGCLRGGSCLPQRASHDPHAGAVGAGQCECDERRSCQLGTVNGAPRSSSAFASLAGAVLLLGIADSMVGSYAVLFAADEVGLGPVQIGVFAS